MNKEDLQKECLHILLSDYEDGGLKNTDIYGVGEFLEGTISDLVPYLNKEGLQFLRTELLRLRDSK